MRKLLLATAALFVMSAGAVHAAEEQTAPLSVNVGGYVDFRIASFNESQNNTTPTALGERRGSDSETEFAFDIAAEGKGSYDTKYGAFMTLSNANNFNNNFQGNGNDVYLQRAYVWLSGRWGKVMLGDEEGPSQLFVAAPSVGEGQAIGNSYKNFVDPATLWRVFPSFVDDSETSTRTTYFTPQLGTTKHNVQAGISYAPNAYDNGQNVIKYNSGTTPTRAVAASYEDWIEASAQYNGDWGPVQTQVGLLVTTATGNKNAFLSNNNLGSFQDFTNWGLGTQVKWNALTVGGSYHDGGDFATLRGQDEDQSVWTLGAKYEFTKVALAANYLGGSGYNNLFGVTGDAGKKRNYVGQFDSYGLGGTYTWLPGLTTTLQGVFFQQERDDTIGGVAAGDNDGNVIMLSQKITF